MTPNEYQEACARTAIYPSKDGDVYTILGLVNEAGEVAGKYKKFIRDGWSYEQIRSEILGELGDVLWYAAMVASEFELQLEDVMQYNLNKLQSRAERGVLGGSGDNR